MLLTIHSVGEFYRHRTVPMHIFNFQRQINTPTNLHINKKAQKQTNINKTEYQANTKPNKECFTAHTIQENGAEADIKEI